MSAYIPVLFPFPAVGKANKRILQCKQTLKWHLGEKLPKKNSLYYVNLKQVIEKLETELHFRKDVNIGDWNVLSVWGMICRIATAKILYAKQNKKKSKKLYFRTAIKFTYSLALTWKVRNDGGSFVR